MPLQTGETSSSWHEDCLPLTGKQRALREATHHSGASELQHQLLKCFAPEQIRHIHLWTTDTYWYMTLFIQAGYLHKESRYSPSLYLQVSLSLAKGNKIHTIPTKWYYTIGKTAHYRLQKEQKPKSIQPMEFSLPTEETTLSLCHILPKFKAHLPQKLQ